MAHRPNRALLRGSGQFWVLGLGQRVFRSNSVSEMRVSGFRVEWEVRVGGWGVQGWMGTGATSHWELNSTFFGALNSRLNSPNPKP